MKQRPSKHKLLTITFITLCFICFNNSGAQILSNNNAIELIRKGIGHIYNMEFDEAANVQDSLQILFPEHPVNHLFSGMMVYWQNFPLIPSSKARKIFEERLYRCIEQTDNFNHDPDYIPEYLLANLSARGLLLLFYADNDLSSEVIPLATQTYRPLMRSFDYTSECVDFYYFTGVYNYYRDAYPKIRPVYQAVAFLFPKGDMKLGISQLEICARESMALQAEAYSMLAWIRMQFENDYHKSLPYCKILHEKYPANVLFKSLYIKNLLLLKLYDEAESEIERPALYSSDGYNQAVLLIFKGLVQEKKYHNNLLAREYYQKGINALSEFLPYGNEYTAYGYFGLSRLLTKEDEKHLKRFYHRKGMELVDFKKITFND
ncbi:MAG: hypothetical protein ACUVTX_12495 [Bacteroidales bacterium]